MIRCCLCRYTVYGTLRTRKLEPTTLPGGWRCTDRGACRERVRDIVAAHKGLMEVCDG